MKGVNGTPLEQVSELVEMLDKNNWRHGYCAPSLWPALQPAFQPVGKGLAHLIPIRARNQARRIALEVGHAGGAVVKHPACVVLL